MITAEDVTVLFRKGRFGKIHKALDGLNLHVEKGEVLALLGPNGAGKSTAMYCFLGLIQPNRGTITVLGDRPKPGSELFSRIAYLPEEPHYHDYLTVREAISFYGRLHGRRISGAELLSVIERVGLTSHQDFRVSKCSKGMKQKVGIAQCLLGNPELVLLDEPTRGLDPTMVKEFREIIVELRARGCTIVVNTHVLSEIEMMCTEVAILKQGRVIRKGPVDAIRNTIADRFVVELQPLSELPPYAVVSQRLSGMIHVEVPADQLWHFMRFLEKKNASFRSCSMKRVSLEEAFLREVEAV